MSLKALLATLEQIRAAHPEAWAPEVSLAITGEHGRTRTVEPLEGVQVSAGPNGLRILLIGPCPRQDPAPAFDAEKARTYPHGR